MMNASSDQPQTQIEFLQLGQLHNDIDALGTQLCAAIEIDSLQIGQIFGQCL